MYKNTMNEWTKADSTTTTDYYILRTNWGWYVASFPSGSLIESEKTMAGFKTLKAAKKCIEAWKIWD